MKIMALQNFERSWAKYSECRLLFPNGRRSHWRFKRITARCYDGCSTMASHRNGVVVQIKEKEKRALYTHCYAQSLNLVIGSTMKNSALLKHTIDNNFELTKLVKKSLKKDSKLKEIQSSLAIADDCDNEDYELNEAKPSISMFCPTWWTVPGKCLMAIIENFDEFQRLWEWAIKNTSDTLMKARIRGISSYSKTFLYCFGIHLAATILNNSDNLSKTLQATQLSAVDARRIARNTRIHTFWSEFQLVLWKSEKVCTRSRCRWTLTTMET